MAVNLFTSSSLSKETGEDFQASFVNLTKEIKTIYICSVLSDGRIYDGVVRVYSLLRLLIQI